MCNKGHVPWNKGASGCYTEAALKRMRVARLGCVPWNKGVPMTDEVKARVSQSCKGIKKPKIAALKRLERGPKHNQWKGGRTISPNGYVWVHCTEHPKANHGYVAEHRLVMEKSLGRYLEPKEVVHHIDGNPSNNDLVNLMLFSNNTEHLAYHRNIKKEIR